MIELTEKDRLEEQEDYNALNEKQKQFFDMAMSGKNMFITGPAGTGKTFLVNRIIKAFERRGKTSIVCATTGVAARSIGGFTLHHQFHLSVTDGTATKDNDWLKDADSLIIDEASMMDYLIFNTIGNEIKEFNPNCQIILIGDFFQLPPVVTDETVKIADHRGYSDQIDRSQYHCFHSHIWRDFNFQTCILTQAMRQDDQAFSTALFNLSRNTLTNNDLTYLSQSQKNTPMKGAIILACTNKVVNAINSQELDKIDSPEKIYKALYWGEYDKEIPKVLKLKIGARVMLTINNPTEGYCNGDMGNITEMNITGVRVKLDSGETVDVPQYDFKTQIFEDGETSTIGGIKQLPLKLAWAITVHKSQGQTFDKVNFLYDKGFFDGANENRTLLYVGLSRARKIENLYLRIKGNLPRFNNEAIVDFYNGKYKTYTSRFDNMIGF